MQYRHAAPWVPDLTSFVSAGVFPIENTALNFGSNDVGSFSSRDKYLGAVQGGLEWQANRNVKLTGAVGYFYFGDIQERSRRPASTTRMLATPTTADLSSSSSATPCFRSGTSLPIRLRRPGRARKCNISAWRRNFMCWRCTANSIWRRSIHSSCASKASMCAIWRSIAAMWLLKVPSTTSGDGGNYEGGGNGWQALMSIGQPDLPNRGDWVLTGGYKFIKSDAVPDAFDDPDFHLGGTNAEGFVLGAGYAFADNANLMLHWLSAKEISGPPYADNVVQLDLNAKF